MRVFELVAESLIAWDAYRDITVQIVRNPGPRALQRLFARYPQGLRGVLSQSGLLVWDAELLHDDALRQLDSQVRQEDKLYLFLLPHVVQIKGEGFSDKLRLAQTIDEPLRVCYGNDVPYAEDDGTYM